MPRPKTNQQTKAIFKLAKKRGIEMDDDTRADFAVTVSKGRTDRISLLTFDEANDLIRHLGGEPVLSSATPRRTVNYHRQQAGVQQIAQKEHLDLMYRLADRRNMTIAGLTSLANKIIKHFPPRTTTETNKVIEAIKAMNRRDARRAKEAA